MGLSMDHWDEDDIDEPREYHHTVNLLKKYISHVWECEGINYLSDSKINSTDVSFNETEILILKMLEKEIQKESK